MSVREKYIAVEDKPKSINQSGPMDSLLVQKILNNFLDITAVHT